MASYFHPGVYVIEVGNPPRAIEAASTSTCIFVGETERGPLSPTKLTSRSDFGRAFRRVSSPGHTASQRADLAYAMDAFFGNGGTTCYVLRAMNARPGRRRRRARLQRPPDRQDQCDFARHLGERQRHERRLGDLPCLVGWLDEPVPRRRRLHAARHRRPDHRRGLGPSVDQSERRELRRRRPRAAASTSPGIRPPSPAVPARSGPRPARRPRRASSRAAATGERYGLTGGLGGNTAAALPDFHFNTARRHQRRQPPRASRASTTTRAGDPQRRGHPVRPHPPAPRPVLHRLAVASQRQGARRPTPSGGGGRVPRRGLPKSDFAAVYFPWIQVSDPVGVGQEPDDLRFPRRRPWPASTPAPTRHRGVWKAPAGVEASAPRLHVDLEFNIQDIQQDIMNPLGINALRNIPGAGKVCWGARTMVPSSQWRYITVRRMAIFLRQSIYNGIQFAVFEGNDEPLWAALRLTIGGVHGQPLPPGRLRGRLAGARRTSSSATPRPPRRPTSSRARSTSSSASRRSARRSSWSSS